MKLTGFEEFYADAPVTPAAFEEEQSLYDKYAVFFRPSYVNRLLIALLGTFRLKRESQSQ